MGISGIIFLCVKRVSPPLPVNDNSINYFRGTSGMLMHSMLMIYSINSNAKRPYIKILTYRNCVVVCTSQDLHFKIREILQNKTRDEIFELPFVYGQTINYVPNDHNKYDYP